MLVTHTFPSLGIGVDLVCMGEQPLHAVPLFKVRHPECQSSEVHQAIYPLVTDGHSLCSCTTGRHPETLVWEMTITFLTGSTTGKTTWLMRIKINSNSMLRWNWLIYILLASLSSTPAASTPPKVRTLVAPSPLESNWLAARYIHIFCSTVFWLKNVEKDFLYVLTLHQNDLFSSFMLRNSRAAKTTVSCDPLSLWTYFLKRELAC